jgi:hypothetical protein
MKHVVAYRESPAVERKAAGNDRKKEAAMNCAIHLHDNAGND